VSRYEDMLIGAALGGGSTLVTWWVTGSLAAEWTAMIVFSVGWFAGLVLADSRSGGLHRH